MSGRGDFDFSDFREVPSTPLRGGQSTVQPGLGMVSPMDRELGLMVGDGSGGSPVVHSGPPVLWLVAATCLAVVGGGLAMVGADQVVLLVVAWLLSGPGAISVLALFMLYDTRRRAEVFYSARTWVTWVYWGSLGLAFVSVILSAVQLALWVGRR